MSLLGGGTTDEIAAVSRNRRGRWTRAEKDVVLGFYGFKLTEGRILPRLRTAAAVLLQVQ